MIEDVRAAVEAADDYVRFHASGEPGRGYFRCAECGYGAAVRGLLPACPMCAGTSWEREPGRSRASIIL